MILLEENKIENKTKELKRFIKSFISLRLKKVEGVGGTKISPNDIKLLYSQGKMVRPRLFFYFSQVFQGLSGEKSSKKMQENEITLASIIEIIHLASLIHDDIIDNDVIRRGQKTINNTFSNGIAVAMGDFLFSSAIELVFKKLNSIDNETKFLMAQSIVDAVTQLSLGELSQDISQTPNSISYTKAIKLTELKTGTLFALPCILAAILHKIPHPYVQRTKILGQTLGIAFQIRDDLVDYFHKNEKYSNKMINGKNIATIKKNTNEPRNNIASIIINKAKEKAKKTTISKSIIIQTGSKKNNTQFELLEQQQKYTQLVEREIKRYKNKAKKIGTEIDNSIDLEWFFNNYLPTTI